MTELDVFGGPSSKEVALPDFHNTPIDSGDWEASAILGWVESFFTQKSAIPTVQEASFAGVDPELYAKWITSIPFRKKLQGRGVGISSGEAGEFRPGGLSEIQYAAIQVMTDLVDGRSEKVKLNELEIPTAQWNNWLHDPVFVEVLNAKSEAALVNSKFQTLQALMDNVRAGDNQAIKLHLEMIGRFTSAKDRVNSIDPLELIQTLVETIMEETKDPKLTQRVGEKLMGVVARIAAGSEVNSNG